jgi:hypothetical protein
MRTAAAAMIRARSRTRIFWEGPVMVVSSIRHADG